MSVWDSSSFSVDRGCAMNPAAVAAAATVGHGLGRGGGPLSRAKPVRILQGGCDAARFQKEVQAAREPVVVRGLLIGQCLGLWNADYLVEKGGDKDVSVHVSTEARMDFVSKNFAYRTLPFSELVRRAAYGCRDSTIGGNDRAANPSGEAVPELRQDEQHGSQTGARESIETGDRAGG
eukprot:CAMPEP_0114118044 /NCGR_PEP_ID=MMETSP0043_2-20121206/5373_1 /TAXON_ID=464988 /ORGANISM="Hemiselmis andersenii, Strain CCMP644" /LENGTH=177 /DNA_ID=CAMNT_0001210509 /DNA_START=112 /DNA_END=642 /DNA_ORIENTATION=-